MKRKTLTLKAGFFSGQPLASSPPTVVAGKATASPSALMLKHLQSHAEMRHRVFIQMKHGTGYCGRIDAFESGWLSMRDTTIHGTKNTFTVPELIVQILDGRQIAHMHATNSIDIGVTK